jgi:hypothetical protein
MVQYWGGCPQTPNSKWQRFLDVITACSRMGWRTCLVLSRLPEQEELWRPFADVGCEIVIHPRATRSFDAAGSVPECCLHCYAPEELARQDTRSAGVR